MLFNFFDGLEIQKKIICGNVRILFLWFTFVKYIDDYLVFLLAALACKIFCFTATKFSL